MITNFIISLIISISINTIIILTPITLGLNVLLIAVVTAVLFAIANSSWIAFLIFLIYIRGTLIIFSYFIAMSPNTQILSYIHIPLIISSPFIIIVIIKISNISNSLSSWKLDFNSFYSHLSSLLLLFIVLILLFTIIIVTKISSTSKGPLRSFN